jgi:glutamate-1-semialdehyde 2,1-aminomutase
MMSRSDEVFTRAKTVMTGGVSAGGRYHPSLKKPLLLESVDGCIMRDVDGQEWIDYHSCSGATLLGFNHPAIREAVLQSVERGFFMNFESPFHEQFARQISKMVPSAQKVRLANSGTEATLAALRLARDFTGRKKFIKFEGHFHGMHEFVFYNWHNRLGCVQPSGEIEKVWDTAGMVSETDDLLVIIPFNDIALFEKTVAAHRGELAGVILEPVMYNAGCIEPRPGYLQALREITTREGMLLIFDEVLSGFRMHPGSAQGYYGVTPDLTTLGKVVGNGMPVAALVGKTEVMDHLNPVGKVVMSGTYTSSLTAVMGALAGLKVLDTPDFYPRLNANADYFYGKVNELLRMNGIKGVLHGLGARFGLYFGLEQPTHDYREAARLYDRKLGRRFYELVATKGLYFHDFGDGLTPMHAGITAVHTKEIFDESLNRLSDVFRQMAGERP